MAGPMRPAAYNPRRSPAALAAGAAFRRSSVVERAAVNRLVVGSNPTAGATCTLNRARSPTDPRVTLTDPRQTSPSSEVFGRVEQKSVASSEPIGSVRKYVDSPSIWSPVETTNTAYPGGCAIRAVGVHGTWPHWLLFGRVTQDPPGTKESSSRRP